MKGRVINTFSTILSKRATLALVFLVLSGLFLASLITKQQQSVLAAHISSTPSAAAPWTDKARIIYDDNRMGWAPASTTSIIIDESVVAVGVYGGSDDGGYCLAYWGESNPGWAAAYRHDGKTGTYPDGSLPQQTCVDVDSDGFAETCTYDACINPEFKSDGSAWLCQEGSSHDYYQYFQNSNGGTSGELWNVNLPAGTAINLKAQHRNENNVGYSRCFLKVVYESDTISSIQSRVCNLSSAGPEWMARYKSNSGGATYGYGTAIDSAGNIYVTGEEFNTVTGLDMYLRKYSSAGNVLWTQTYDAGNGGNEAGYGVAVDSAGNVYVVGRKDVQNAGDAMSFADMFIRKYDANGGILWTQTSDRAGADLARSVAVDSSGNIYAAGYEQHSGRSDIDAVIWQFNSSGNFLNTVSYDIGGNESAYGVALDSNNDIYITGYQSSNGADMFLIKYDALLNPINSFGPAGSGGTVIYDSVLSDLSTNFTTVAQSTCIDHYTGLIYEREGSVARIYIAGWGWTGENWFRNCTGAEYSKTSTGKRLFYEFNWNDIPPEAQSVTVRIIEGNSVLGTETFDRNTHGGSVDCGGSVFTSFCSGGANTISETRFQESLCSNCSNGGAQSPNLSLQVSWQISSAPTDIGRGVSVSDDGTVFVTGYQSSNGGDVFVRAYDVSNGNLKARDVYNSGGSQNDLGKGIVSGNNGRVYITGHQGTNNNDIFLRENFLGQISASLQQYFPNAYKFVLTNDLVSSDAGNEMAYGIAIDSNNVDEPVYVAGYRDSNGGEAFLNKYSCNAPAAGGAATASGAWSTLRVTPATEGNAPFTVTATGNVTIPDPVAYTWDWGDGETSTGQIATHTYRNTTGTTTNPLLTLKVQNLTVASESDIATTTMTIYPDVSPEAGFTVIPATGAAPLLVRVNSTSTDASPGKIISYSWNWGDGTAPGNGVQTSHVYTNAGDYTITLTVRDDGGMPAVSASRIINVTWACTGYSGPNGTCNPTSDIPICAPGNQCVECLADYDCEVGSRCTGTSCKQGDLCPDGNECPIDGKCAELDLNNISIKNTCVLSSDSLGANCYIEEISSSCTDDLQCTRSVMGGKCDTISGNCRYARCLNESSKVCTQNSNCAGGDGICDANVCKYIYDCAYGPGMSSGTVGRYATATPPTMPAMPVGPQPEGQACTQPTPDAPTNCEGINGCLYYNFDSNGNPIQNSNNSVANCLDKFNGGTGCVYYQYYDAGGAGQTTKANCLASSDGIAGAKKRTVCIPGNPCADGQICPASATCLATPVTAGIPDGCIQVAKGKDSKGNIKYDYNCSNIDGCYYKADGGIDCTYTDGVPQPGGVSGNGCIYEPNPEGAIFCPGATKPATGGENYVQCLLNPDATLPWYLRDRTATTTAACKTNADCPVGNICLDGACYPECQGDLNCATGQSCVNTCNTVYDCPSDSYICDGVCTLCLPGDPSCTPAIPLCAGAQPTGNLPYGTNQTAISMQTTQDATCRYSTIQGTPYSVMTETFGTTGNTTHNEDVFGLMPLPSINRYFVECQTASGVTPACRIEFGVGGCQAGTYCPDGNLCPANGVCPPLPYCSGAIPPPGTSLPLNTTSVNIGLSTDEESVCRYSQTLPSYLLSKLDKYLGMPTLFSTINGLIHTDIVTSNLVTGNNSYYALCQENSPPQNIAPLCQISFNIGVCNEEFKCANGWLCEPNTGNGICVPPPCSNVSVVSPPFNSDGTLPATTTAVTLQATTDDPANCAYGDNRSEVFDTMTPFAPIAPANGLVHTVGNVSVIGGGNIKYVKCQDSEGEDTCSVSFKVGPECGVNGACPSGLECRNGACLYPICENAYPANVPEGTTETTMGLTTNTDAECRYSKTTADFNSQTVFNNTGGQAHSTLVTDLVSRRNRYIVDCRDSALPNKIKICEIPIHVGSCVAGWDCEAGYGCNLGAGVCESCDTNPELPECQPWCVRFPWLCNPGGGPGPGVDPLPPVDGASCSFMGITFFGDAVDGDGTCDILAMILAIISWMAWLVALLAVLSGLRAAYLYITAMGNEKRLILARSYLIYTTIGVVVAILSFGLVAIVRALMGI